MITDTEIKVKELRTLAEARGHVDAGRFITLMMREPFNCTQWQQQWWPERSVEAISRSAMELRDQTDRSL